MRARTVLAFLAAAAIATTAAAEKQSGTVQCKPDPSQPVEVGDKPNHFMGVMKSNCTWTTPMETAGLKTKEGASVAFSDGTGDKFTANGTHFSTMDNGDKIFVHFQGTGTSKEGKFQTDSGKWSYTGGTGKLKGIKGGGTYKGKGNPDGSVTYEIAGDYTVGK
jgi:hypothetical protein